MFKVHILGCSSATPAFSRHPSAQIVEYHDRYYLVDCGEGTQMQLQRFKIKYSRIDAIFISHLHGDHILGLPGLLATLNIFERTDPLPVYAPAGMKDIIQTIYSHSDTYLKYDVHFYFTEEKEPGEIVYETPKIRVKLLPLVHRTFCRGFLFEEVNKKPKFDFYKAKSLNIPNDYFRLLKQGNDITLPDGRMVRADEVLFPPDPPMSYAYCSDTRYSPELIPYIEGATLLYHEATFLHSMRDRAAETHHSTAREAAMIAKESKADQLIIGHFSARYKDLTPLLDEAREIFPNTHLAIDGKVFDLKISSEHA